MRAFEELVEEATIADVTGWGFDWLDGRATEQRPPWSYVTQLGDRLAQVDSAVDLDTGGGEVLDEVPQFPARMYATESWAPNAERAKARLRPRGVQVVETTEEHPMPFPDQSFELVTSRHPVQPVWNSIHRVLKPGGLYFAQHVGPASAFDLIEFFLGPLPRERRARDPKVESDAAEAAGLTVTSLETAQCRMEFYDVGAVIWILRKCVWWVPDFSVEKYFDKLRELDAMMRAGELFVAYSTRHLIEAPRS